MRAKNSILTLFLATGAASVSATGCARHADTDVSPNAETSVLVVNNNFNDLNVFASRPGAQRIRLGQVTGSSSATFKLPPQYVAWGSIQIVGVPIGGFGAARTGELQIGPGEKIVFTVQQRLAMSSATIEQQ